MTARCQYCHRVIRWCTTTTGHRIPVDPTPAEHGNLRIDETSDPAVAHVVAVAPGLHIAHFATCPGADHARHPRSPAAEQPALFPITEDR